MSGRRLVGQASSLSSGASRAGAFHGLEACPTSAFTFVEMLAALAFLGILIPVVIQALLVSNRAGLVTERSTIAMQLGENRLNELMIGDEWSSASARGDFGESWPGYRWELAKADWESGAMTELKLDVFFTVQGHEHDLKLGTLVNESLSQQQ